MTAAPLSPVRARALAAHGALNDWMEVLVATIEKSSQKAVADRLGVTSSLLSQVLGGTYPSPTEPLEAKVRAHLMGEEVYCRGWGMVISRRQCLDDQQMPFPPASPAETQVYRACRAGCPHSRITAKEDRP